MGLLWDPRFSFALFLVIVRDLQWRFAMKAIIIVILNCLKSLFFDLFTLAIPDSWLWFQDFLGQLLKLVRLAITSVLTSKIVLFTIVYSDSRSLLWLKIIIASPLL